MTATVAYSSTFLGYRSGYLATNANNSVFIGTEAGHTGTYVNNSVFIGTQAGFQSLSSSYSVLIGHRAGYDSAGGFNGINSNNIIIGTNITLPSLSKDSINIGGLIFGTGSYSTTTGTPSSSPANGRIGINKVSPVYTLDVSGSGNYTNGLTVTGSLIAPVITGSLFGTSSWSQNAVTSSYILNSVSASYAATAALAPNYVLTSVTGSMLQPYVLTSQTSSMTVATASIATSSSYALTASYASNGGVTQIIAGSNISISPTSGLGAVTINSTATSGGAGTNTTASFSNLSTWTFTHNLNSQYVIIQIVDSNGNQIIPQNIALTNVNTATITFPTAESGIAIASLGGVGTSAATASYVTPYETAWAAYTPVWTAASVNPVIGNGTIQGWYKLVGKTCFVRGNVAMGSTTTFGSGEWYISMPVTASIADSILMSANILDNTTAWYNATVNGARAGFNYKTAIQYQNVAGTTDSIDSTHPMTWTNSDRFIWNGSYEIA